MIALSQRMTKCCNLQSKESLDSELIDVKASLCRPLTAVQLCELLNGGHAVSLLGESIANWSFVALRHSIMDYLLLLHCATFASNSSIYFRPNCLEKKTLLFTPSTELQWHDRVVYGTVGIEASVKVSMGNMYHFNE